MMKTSSAKKKFKKCLQDNTVLGEEEQRCHPGRKPPKNRRAASWRGTKPSRPLLCSFRLDTKVTERIKGRTIGPTHMASASPPSCPFPTRPARTHYVNPFPARSFFNRQGRNISEIRTIRGHESTSGRQKHFQSSMPSQDMPPYQTFIRLEVIGEYFVQRVFKPRFRVP